MTAHVSYTPLPTAEALFRDHIKAMHSYANELESVLGSASPIAARIHSCAHSNQSALDRIAEIRTKTEARLASCECNRSCPTCGAKRPA